MMNLSIKSGWHRFLIRAICIRNGARAEFGDTYIDIIRDRRAIRISVRHIAYVPDLVHNFDQYFMPVFPEQRGTRELVDFSSPRIHRYRDTGLEFELTSLPEETSALEGYFRWYRPRLGDLVFDAGAYCGVSSYHLSQMVGAAGRVYAFEPDPENFAALQRNIEQHRLQNVTPVCLGLSGRNGTAVFQSEGALGSTLVESASRPSAGALVDVRTVTLEEACTRYGIPAFAKIDIEGAELEMIAAAHTYLTKHDINFVFDTNHTVDNALTASRLESLLRDCGYESESSDALGFMTTWARKRKWNSNPGEPSRRTSGMPAPLVK